MKNTSNKILINNFWKSTHIDKVMHEIAKYECDVKSVNSTDLKNTLSATTSGKNGGTWMHLYSVHMNFFDYVVLRKKGGLLYE